MVSNLLWAVGTNGYLATATTLLSTELNSLASGSLGSAGSAIDNSAGDKAIYWIIELLLGGSITTGTNPYAELWFLRTIDGGSNYEDGSSSVTPGRRPDVIIPFRPSVAAAQRVIVPAAVFPSGQFKPLLKQTTGATWPSSGNTLKARPYAPAI